MRTIKGNILDQKRGFIFQVVNCQDRMGSGLAKAISDKWPVVKERYHKFNEGREPIILLGSFDIIEVERDLYVINVYGQLDYGRDGKRYVDYHAVKYALHQMMWWKGGYYCHEAAEAFFDECYNNANIFFPYLFGCGLAGGDWRIMSRIISLTFPNVTIVELSK